MNCWQGNGVDKCFMSESSVPELCSALSLGSCTGARLALAVLWCLPRGERWDHHLDVVPEVSVAGVATAPPGAVPYIWDTHIPFIPPAMTKWVLAKPRAFSFFLQEQGGCYKQS